MNLEHYHNPPPSFTNPWSSSSSPPHAPAPSSSMYVPGSQQPSNLTAGLLATKPPVGRPGGPTGGSTIPSFGSLPVTSSAGRFTVLSHHSYRGSYMLTPCADILSLNRLPPTSGPYGETSYSTSASPASGQFATSGASYDGLGYAPAPIRPSQFGLDAERSSKYAPT